VSLLLIQRTHHSCFFSRLEQNLVPSGCQPWSRFMCSLTSEHFVYCSSLATYVFKVPEFTLQHLLTGHQKTITGLAACRTNPHVIATSSVDRTIRVWDIDKGVEVCKATNKPIPLPNQSKPAIIFLCDSSLDVGCVTDWKHVDRTT
jgi:WD40 repeat protein